MTKKTVGFKRKFNLLELYCALVFLPRAILTLSKNKKSQLIDGQFAERLQLAVTEVNGCAACSYQHTKMALRRGISDEEINSFLAGDDRFVKPEEAKAILFAQHFAEAKGKPKKYAFDSIVQEYGKEKAQVILSACQVMIAGNMYGIAFSALQSRLKGKSYKGSNLFYEFGMLIGGVLCLPIAFVHALLRRLAGLRNEKFDKNTAE